MWHSQFFPFVGRQVARKERISVAILSERS
jgi:hypothetical protein